MRRGAWHGLLAPPLRTLCGPGLGSPPEQMLGGGYVTPRIWPSLAEPWRPGASWCSQPPPAHSFNTATRRRRQSGQTCGNALFLSNLLLRISVPKCTEKDSFATRLRPPSWQPRTGLKSKVNRQQPSRSAKSLPHLRFFDKTWKCTDRHQFEPVRLRAGERETLGRKRKLGRELSMNKCFWRSRCFLPLWEQAGWSWRLVGLAIEAGGFGDRSW